MNARQGVDEAYKYEIDLTGYGKITAQELATRLQLDMVRSATPHEKAISSTALSILALDLLTHHLTIAMFMANNGEWSQPIFSHLGDDLKRAVEQQLKKLSSVEGIAKEVLKAKGLDL